MLQHGRGKYLSHRKIHQGFTRIKDGHDAGSY